VRVGKYSEVIAREMVGAMRKSKHHDRRLSARYRKLIVDLSVIQFAERFSAKDSKDEPSSGAGYEISRASSSLR